MKVIFPKLYSTQWGKSTAAIRIIKPIMVMILLILCEWFFFRNVIFTGTGALLGDNGDGRLTMLITEHWWHFFTGKEKFNELSIFHPTTGVLGYSDLLFGYGLLHSSLRAIGINIYLSYKWTLIAIHAMGAISMYYLMHKTIKCNIVWSLFATIAFCYSSSYARFFNHAQLNAISFLPLLLILFIGVIDNYKNRKTRNIYAYLCIVWFVLLTYTSWYVACFTGVFCLIFLIVYGLYIWRFDHFTQTITNVIHTISTDAIGYLLITIILYIPFLMIYLPVLRGKSGYSYEKVWIFMPEIADIINVTDSNFMLGSLMARLNYNDRGYSDEVPIGFSIILLILFFIMFLKNQNHFNRLRWLGIKKNGLGKITNVTILRALFITITICLFIVPRLSANGISLWWFFYTIVPIARSVRAVGRFWLWLSFPMSVITAYTANRELSLSNGNMKFIPVLLTIILFISNINIGAVDSSWYWFDEENFVQHVSAPPKDMESFYIVDTGESKDWAYVYQLDAFEIADRYGVKTINGYSGQQPENWDGIWDVCSDGYEQSVNSWIKEHDLNHVYAYDRATNKWIPYESNP